MLEERIYKDYVEALKSRDKQKADFLSFIRAQIKNRAISLKKEKLDDREVIGVLDKQRKQLEEARESVSSSGRQDLVNNIEKELAIVKGYLPEPLSEEEILRVVDDVISQLNVTSIKEMGRVMKEVISRTSFRADARKISEIVRRRLTST